MAFRPSMSMFESWACGSCGQPRPAISGAGRKWHAGLRFLTTRLRREARSNETKLAHALPDSARHEISPPFAARARFGVRRRVWFQPDLGYRAVQAGEEPAAAWADKGTAGVSRRRGGDRRRKRGEHRSGRQQRQWRRDRRYHGRAGRHVRRQRWPSWHHRRPRRHRPRRRRRGKRGPLLGGHGLWRGGELLPTRHAGVRRRVHRCPASLYRRHRLRRRRRGALYLRTGLVLVSFRKGMRARLHDEHRLPRRPELFEQPPLPANRLHGDVQHLSRRLRLQHQQRVCARKACQTDAECSRACVEGRCYASPGTCRLPVP